MAGCQWGISKTLLCDEELPVAHGYKLHFNVESDACKKLAHNTSM